MPRTIAAAALAIALLTGCRAAEQQHRPEIAARLDIEAAAHATPENHRADIVARLSVEIR